MPKKRVGRPPSENPKNLRIDIRLTKEEMEILDVYCKKMGVSRPQGLRDGIKLLPTK